MPFCLKYENRNWDQDQTLPDRQCSPLLCHSLHVACHKYGIHAFEPYPWKYKVRHLWLYRYSLLPNIKGPLFPGELTGNYRVMAARGCWNVFNIFCAMDGENGAPPCIASLMYCRNFSGEVFQDIPVGACIITCKQPIVIVKHTYASLRLRGENHFLWLSETASVPSCQAYQYQVYTRSGYNCFISSPALFAWSKDPHYLKSGLSQ